MNKDTLLKSIILVSMLMGVSVFAQDDYPFDTYVQEKYADCTMQEFEDVYEFHSQNITMKYSKFTQSIKKILDLLKEKKEALLKNFQTAPIKDLLDN